MRFRLSVAVAGARAWRPGCTPVHRVAWVSGEEHLAPKRGSGILSRMHPRNQVVQDALQVAGIAAQIEFLDEHARTAALAAAQLGCEVAAIANSLVFMADGQPLLVMASGAARVNTDTIAAAVGAESVTKASADQVRAATGQVIGGVAPTGHPTPLPTLVDPDLGLHDTIWAAGGTPDSIVGLTFQQLVVITAGHVTPVR